MQITWLGHSTIYLKTTAGTRILIDAWIENNPACPPEWHTKLRELGVDIIKTLWTGSAESFRSVVEGCPAIVALAGGDMGETLEDYLRMTREALDVGLGGVTYGRFVWQHPHTSSVIKALHALIHQNASVIESLAVYEADVLAEAQ